MLSPLALLRHKLRTIKIFMQAWSDFPELHVMLDFQFTSTCFRVNLPKKTGDRGERIEHLKNDIPNALEIVFARGGVYALEKVVPYIAEFYELPKDDVVAAWLHSFGYAHVRKAIAA